MPSFSTHPRHVSRRAFLQAGAGAVAGLATLGPLTAQDQAGVRREARGGMVYRRLGRTELMVSEVSLGGSPQPEEALFREAIDRGINYIDASPVYGRGNCEREIAKVIGGIRESFHVTTKIHPYNFPTTAEMIAQVEESLERLGTDYVDILQIHGAGDTGVLDNPEVLGAFSALKEQGKIRFTGLTCHADPVTVCTHAIRSGNYDVVTIAYHAYNGDHEGNLYDDYLSETGIAGVIREAVAADVGVIAMKSQAGGELQDVEPYTGTGSTLAQAKLRWVLSNPGVTAVITEILTEQQMEEDLAVVGQPASEQERAALQRHVAATSGLVCRLCGTCTSQCPAGVAVADILRYERYHSGYRRPDVARAAYAALPDDRRVSACMDCGGCERSCPFGVASRERLRQAHRVLA